MKENLVYSHAMWQPLSVCMLQMCAFRNPKLYQKFKLIGFKTHDLNHSTIDMIIKTKQMFFFSRVSEVGAVKVQYYSGKDGGEQQLIYI